MTWSNAGTVEITQGGVSVTGTGTSFIGQREGWLIWIFGEDRPHEIANVTSETALTLVDPIESASASGLAYVIIPTQGDLIRVREKIDQLIESVNNSRAAWDQVFVNFSLGNYQLWLDEGNTGSPADFLAFLVGPKGDKGDQGDQGIQGIQGIQGHQGWSPAFSLITDGERRVLQVQGWIGGAGAAPATGDYVGAAGLVADIANAIDVRGAVGPQGAGLVLRGTLNAVGDLPATGVPGDAWLVGAASPRNVYVWDDANTEWDDGGPLEGPKGDKGDKGDQGDVGPQGPPGTTDYNALQNRPTLGTAAAQNSDAFATAAQGTKADNALPASSLPALVTQAAAEAGTITDPRLWSPLRIAQAIAALGASGGMELIDHVSLTNGLSVIDMLMPAEFTQFKLIGGIERSTGSFSTTLLLSTDGGSTFPSSFGQYQQDGGTTSIFNISTSDRHVGFEVDLIGSKVAGANTGISCQSAEPNDFRVSQGRFTSTLAVDALRLNVSNPSTQSGDIFLYGIGRTA